MRSVGDRISIIEAMRGIASVGVALFHFSGQLASTIPLILHHLGWLGIDVFFVISGFVIPLSLHGRNYRLRDFPNFLLRRIVRLEPPYIVSLGLTLLMWHLSALLPGFNGNAPDYSFAQIAFHLFYAIPLTDYHWISPVYWSLAYEFVFYIVVGFTFSVLIKRRIEFTMLAVCLVLAALCLIQSKLDARMLEFAVGVLVMRFVVEKSDRARTGVWIAVCLGVVFWTGGPLIGGAVTLAATAILVFRRINCGYWAVFLGGISYSLYGNAEQCRRNRRVWRSGHDFVTVGRRRLVCAGEHWFVPGAFPDRFPGEDRVRV